MRRRRTIKKKVTSQTEDKLEVEDPIGRDEEKEKYSSKLKMIEEERKVVFEKEMVVTEPNENENQLKKKEVVVRKDWKLLISLLKAHLPALSVRFRSIFHCSYRMNPISMMIFVERLIDLILKNDIRSSVVLLLSVKRAMLNKNKSKQFISK